MDLIYADANKEDIGVITSFELDNEAGTTKKECTFEFDSTVDLDVYQNARFLYIEGTEYGGVVDGRKINTSKGVMTLTGRTWRGVLGSKILEPASGQAYYTVSGELHSVLDEIIHKIALSDLFSVESVSTGKTVTYKFERYTDAYRGICKMLKTVGYKLMLEWTQGTVKLSALPIAEYENGDEITSDLFDFVIDGQVNAPNHIIALGSGNLTARQVINKYIQEDGSIGDTQYYFGADEYTETLDYPNAESLEDLESKAVDRLEKAFAKSNIKISAKDLNADIGDKFTAKDIYTGLTVSQYVTNKIIKIKKNDITISYKVGDKI